MSAPFPYALRERFHRLIEEGLSARSAASRLKLSAATGVRWAALIRSNGHAQAAPQGRARGFGKLAPYPDFFEALINQDVDITLPELAGALHDAHGVSAHPASIGRYLGKLGFTHKKVTGRE